MKYKLKSSFFYLFVNYFICFSAISWADVSKSDQYAELDVKAVMLEKITRFIEWPNEVNVSESSRFFIIGVIGNNNAFAQRLETAFSRQKIRDKEVKIRLFSNLKEIARCHLLVISRSEKSNVSAIVSALKNKPILLVGDTDHFAEMGVHINFYLRSDGKLKFEINKDAILSAGLAVSFRLIEAGTLVETRNESERP
ncbi:MAG: YfiR family protein [Candidatus Omnitrophota bacterium]